METRALLEEVGELLKEAPSLVEVPFLGRCSEIVRLLIDEIEERQVWYDAVQSGEAQRAVPKSARA